VIASSMWARYLRQWRRRLRILPSGFRFTVTVSVGLWLAFVDSCRSAKSCSIMSGRPISSRVMTSAWFAMRSTANLTHSPRGMTWDPFLADYRQAQQVARCRFLVSHGSRRIGSTQAVKYDVVTNQGMRSSAADRVGLRPLVLSLNAVRAAFAAGLGAAGGSGHLTCERLVRT
jgi:hypothetical protein